MVLAVVFCHICGCSQPAPSPPPSTAEAVPSVPLRVLIVDDPSLADAVVRQWAARADSEIEVVPSTTDDLLRPDGSPPDADVLIYPSGLLGELAEREWLTPISQEAYNSPEFGRRDVFELIRQREIAWGEAVVAVPFGSPPLTLIYDPSPLEALGAGLPQTWQEYQELCGRLSASTDAAPGDDASVQVERYPVVEPLGPGWAGQVLLARAAGYARHQSYFAALFDLDSMQPLIDSPPFVRAMDELLRTAALGPPEAIEYTPTDVRRLLASGRCVMGLSWPSSAEPESDAEQSPRATGPPVSLATAELPGSREVYYVGDAQWQDRESPETGRVTLLSVSGRLGSVTSTTRRNRLALSLLLRLTSSEWSPDISPYSPATTLYRTSHLPHAAAWVGENFDPAAALAYGEQTKQALRRPLSVTSLRLPGRRRYLAALDEAVQGAIRGDATSQACLNQAAARWQEITAEIGLEKQKAAYWRSLGLEP